MTTRVDITVFTRVVSCFLTFALLGQNRLSPEQERGRLIFTQGRSSSGQAITANVAGGNPIPAAVLPCSNCHGADGRGKPEAGVVPSNITWDALTKPYGLTHPNGRTHPPYTDHSLKRAISMGIDPAGNTLDGAMPRYQLSLADAADLVAYIKSIGEGVDAGVTETAVRLGVILPPASVAGSTNRMMRQVLLSYFARLNAAGGLFNRRVDVAFCDLPPDRTERAAAVREFLTRENIFAVACGDFTGAEGEIARALLDTRTPGIAAFAAFPDADARSNSYVFYLDGGLHDEAAKMVDIAGRRFNGKNSRSAIVSSDDEVSEEGARWLQSQLQKSGFGEVTVSRDPEEVRTARIIFWLRPELPKLQVRRDPKKPSQPTFLIPGSIALRADPNAATRAIWSRTTAASEIMEEALKRAGRELTRSKLIEVLEGFRLVQSSFGTPLTFGSNRRVGASNAIIMTVDQESGSLIAIENGSESR